jgi:hypothetical protein
MLTVIANASLVSRLRDYVHLNKRLPYVRRVPFFTYRMLYRNVVYLLIQGLRTFVRQSTVIGSKPCTFGFQGLRTFVRKSTVIGNNASLVVSPGIKQYDFTNKYVRSLIKYVALRWYIKSTILFLLYLGLITRIKIIYKKYSKTIPIVRLVCFIKSA